MGYCKNCKNELNDNAKFCPSCGEKVLRENLNTIEITIERINSLDKFIENLDQLLSCVDFEKDLKLEDEIRLNYKCLKFTYKDICEVLNHVSHLIIDNNLYYIGEISNGKREGKGVLFEKSVENNEIEIVYYGNWTNDKRCGFGTSFRISLIEYIGEWEDDFYCGEGKIYLEINDHLKVFERGYITGDFTLSTESNYTGIPKCISIEEAKEFSSKGELLFEGSFVLDRSFNHIWYNSFDLWKKDGEGTEYYENTDRVKFEGEYKLGLREGNGNEFYDNGQLKITGNWVNNILQGEVQIYYENGNLAYNGQWFDFKRNGYGIQYYENGNIKQEGELKDDLVCGKNKLYLEDGRLHFEGNIFKSPDGDSFATGAIVYGENGELLNLKGHIINGEFIPVKDIQTNNNSPIKPKDGAGLR